MINDYIISIKKPKRTYQNSLFVDYLSQKDKLIRIFNAVTGENCPLDVEGFEINTLHPILFDDFVNDVSFKIGNRYMFLLEHQSTVCPNIPLRMILYHNQFILKLIVVRDKKDKRKLKVDDRLYSTTRIIIPMPIFVEFYTGETKANLPEESDYTVELLSESFSPKAPLDCRLFNFKGFPVQLSLLRANIAQGHSQKLKQLLPEIDHYSIYISKVKEGREKGLTLTEAINQATEYCMANDIMMPYLQEKGTEVYNMLELQFKLEDGMRVSKAEGKAVVFQAIDYLLEGRSIAETATLTGLSEDEVKTLSGKVRQ